MKTIISSFISVLSILFGTLYLIPLFSLLIYPDNSITTDFIIVAALGLLFLGYGIWLLYQTIKKRVVDWMIIIGVLAIAAEIILGNFNHYP